MQQPVGIGPVSGQTRDGVDGFARRPASDGSPPADTTHLPHARPTEVVAEGVGAPQLTMFDPAVPFGRLGRVVDLRFPLPLLPGGKWAD